ncbi:hypothetical protein STCU_11511 [Strigomonas culicis]|uniref:Uncharacterized protein n=1 Tax=Strigomonas culicis TaxID=28005 RepID=S9TDS3_9TRYP|nr:hypothetical protein STCU_11511 [Strigomonas culicis]|eukprot:EPY16162.1 hypothetical protein STCU_11511 [Strigomonas culicis]
MFFASRPFCIRAVRVFMPTEAVHTGGHKGSPVVWLDRGRAPGAADGDETTAARLSRALAEQQQQRRRERLKEEEARRRSSVGTHAIRPQRAKVLHDMPSDRSLLAVQADFTESYGRSALLTMDCHADKVDGDDSTTAEVPQDGEANGTSATLLHNINVTWKDCSAAEKMQFVCMSPQGRRSARALERLMAKREAPPPAAAATQRGRRRRNGKRNAAAGQAPAAAPQDRLSRLLRHYAAAGARRRQAQTPPGLLEPQPAGSPHMGAVFHQHHAAAAPADGGLSPIRHAVNETKRKDGLRLRQERGKMWEEQWSSLLPAGAAGVYHQLKRGGAAHRASVDFRKTVPFKAKSPPISHDVVVLSNEFRLFSPRKAFVMRRLAADREATAAAAADGAPSRLAEVRARAQQYSDEYDAHLARLRAAEAQQAADPADATAKGNGTRSVFYPRGKSAVDAFKEALLEEEVAKLKEDLRSFAGQLPQLERVITKDYGGRKVR